VGRPQGVQRRGCGGECHRIGYISDWGSRYNAQPPQLAHATNVVGRGAVSHRRPVHGITHRSNVRGRHSSNRTATGVLGNRRRHSCAMDPATARPRGRGHGRLARVSGKRTLHRGGKGPSPGANGRREAHARPAADPGIRGNRDAAAEGQLRGKQGKAGTARPPWRSCRRLGVQMVASSLRVAPPWARTQRTPLRGQERDRFAAAYGRGSICTETPLTAQGGRIVRG